MISANDVQRLLEAVAGSSLDPNREPVFKYADEGDLPRLIALALARYLDRNAAEPYAVAVSTIKHLFDKRSEKTPTDPKLTMALGVYALLGGSPALALASFLSLSSRIGDGDLIKAVLSATSPGSG